MDYMYRFLTFKCQQDKCDKHSDSGKVTAILYLLLFP
jgi:hypothetical protein